MSPLRRLWQLSLCTVYNILLVLHLILLTEVLRECQDLLIGEEE